MHMRHLNSTKAFLVVHLFFDGFAFNYLVYRITEHCYKVRLAKAKVFNAPCSMLIPYPWNIANVLFDLLTVDSGKNGLIIVIILILALVDSRSCSFSSNRSHKKCSAQDSKKLYRLQTMKKRKQNTDRKKRAAYEVDPFSRLPDELFVSILSRLPDLKSLCQYSLVSKHFASVIFQLQFVSLTLKNNVTENNVTDDTRGNLGILVRKLGSARPVQFPRLLDSLSLQHLKLPKFLNYFEELESVYLEYAANPEERIDNPSFPNWMVEFANGSGNLVKTFVAVLRDSVHEKVEGEAIEEQVDGEEENSLELRESRVRYCLRTFHRHFVEFMCLVYMLVKSHATIKSITITDPYKRGKLVMGHEQLVKMRGGPYKRFEVHPSDFNFYFVPKLYLPVSGYIMKNVALVIFHPATDLSEVAESAKEKLSLACEEEKLTPEVVIETLKRSAYEKLIYG